MFLTPKINDIDELVDVTQCNYFQSVAYTTGYIFKGQDKVSLLTKRLKCCISHSITTVVPVKIFLNFAKDG